MNPAKGNPESFTEVLKDALVGQERVRKRARLVISFGQQVDFQYVVLALAALFASH